MDRQWRHRSDPASRRQVPGVPRCIRHWCGRGNGTGRAGEPCGSVQLTRGRHGQVGDAGTGGAGGSRRPRADTAAVESTPRVGSFVALSGVLQSVRFTGKACDAIPRATLPDSRRVLERLRASCRRGAGDLLPECHLQRGPSVPVGIVRHGPFRGCLAGLRRGQRGQRSADRVPVDNASFHRWNHRRVALRGGVRFPGVRDLRSIRSFPGIA